MSKGAIRVYMTNLSRIGLFLIPREVCWLFIQEMSVVSDIGVAIVFVLFCLFFLFIIIIIIIIIIIL